MYKAIVVCFKMIFRLFALLLVGSILLVVRYIFRTPQPLESVLPGEAHLYRWTYGQIYYQVLGSQEAPPFVLVHAPRIGASSYEMRNIIRELAQHYRVYALDLLGFGLSDAPTIDYSANTYITLLHDFLTAVVGGPVTLLGSGLSCHYCTAVAASHPALCKRLVLLSSPAFSPYRRLAHAIAFIASVPFFDLALYSLLSMRFLLPEGNIAQREEREQSRNYRFVVAHQLNAHRAGLAFLAGRLALEESAMRFAAIQQPVLELWGTERLQEIQLQALQEFTMPQAQIVLLRDVGPYALEEQPQAVVTHMLAWERQLNDAVATEAYCVKCRQRRVMENAKAVVTKNGRDALEGNCPVCGTRLFRFISKQ